jgi:hypothetical protein
VNVVIGFELATREAVDERYAELTSAGYPGRSRRSTPSGVRGTRSSPTRTATTSA